MVEEFDALGVSFKERGTLADEQLAVINLLWKEEKPRFEGRDYRFSEIGLPRSLSRNLEFPCGLAGKGFERSGEPPHTAMPGSRTL